MGTNYYFEQRPPCKECGRGYEKKHIGKSSSGWVFALHVYPEDGIRDLNDWVDLFASSETWISDEYGKHVSKDEMLGTIMLRWRTPTDRQFDYISNFAEPGPRGLVRSKIGKGCIKHGDGSWDCHVGDFS